MNLTSPTVDVAADPHAFYEQMIDERWCDGAPVLPATDAAVSALLAHSPYPADHVVCVLPPINGVATVELVAVNAAMAGVAPAAFPWVIAVLEAISAPPQPGLELAWMAHDGAASAATVRSQRKRARAARAVAAAAW